MIFVPYFIGERARDATRLAPADVVEPDLPDGTAQERLGVLYRTLADRVAASDAPRVQVGDCTATIGVLAGIQRRGVDPTLVWFDAHGDFNTWETTPSGFLGGMPLAMLAGLGEQTIAAAVGLRTLPAQRILLVGARDLDPGERDNLERLGVPRATVAEVASAPPPDGPITIHLDVDVVDPSELPAINYPAPGGPSAAEVRAALDALFATGRVAAFSMTGWDPDKPGAEQSRKTVTALTRGLIA